ncbi:hypothetical protein X801_05030 [Opisthorchis viverrini]|uniref:Uncharacterized protein n=1 Tax=Opisthorchis viverrini TaxID=6198 RepID=A0A1S8WX60_OPIVI|nr:hypothetical protein X801_05030 [Opisthorchis viverrini]
MTGAMCVIGCDTFSDDVSECCTLREIQQQVGGLTGPFKESVITNWLQSQNTTELDYIRQSDSL